MSIHKGGSSSTWQDEAVPRLCQFVVDANSGIASQIAENRTDLLDILPLSALSAPTDDLGLTPAFLAVYYDRPDMLEYLFKRGVDFKVPCDPMNYGTPMFYAVTLNRARLISQLDHMGCTIHAACDKLGGVPMMHAVRLDNPTTIAAILWAAGKEMRAAILFFKHWLRVKCRKRYMKMRLAIPLLQRVVRGMIGRSYFRKVWAAKQTLERRAARALRRAQKIEDGEELDSDDEDTVIDEPVAEGDVGEGGGGGGTGAAEQQT